MNSRNPPITLEDRTGRNHDSDFDDMYDRMFYHVSRSPGKTTTRVYEMSKRASNFRSTLPMDRDPIVYLEFLPNESLGSITYIRAPSRMTIGMAQYLKKLSFFGS